MLPDESAAETALAVKFPYLFQTAHDVHALAIEPFGPDGIKGTEDAGIDRIVVLTAVGVLVKALKQHRSIQVLAEKGLGQDALAISRNLFETMMAMAFLLKRRMVLKQGGKKMTAVPKKPLTTPFRARMYHANNAFEKERTNAEFAKTRGLKGYAKKLTTAKLKAEIAKVESILGPDWTKRLKDRKSYSGLSVKDLAISLRLGVAYATHYRVGSWSVHPGTLYRFIEFDDQGGPSTVHLGPSDTDVKEAVSTANMFLFFCIDFMNDRLGLGLDDKLKEMKKRVMPGGK